VFFCPSGAKVARGPLVAGPVAIPGFPGDRSELSPGTSFTQKDVCRQNQGKREVGCRRTKTASKPVKLQRPDKGRRVQSLLSRTCSPAPCGAKNKPRQVLGNRQNCVAVVKSSTGAGGNVSCQNNVKVRFWIYRLPGRFSLEHGPTPGKWRA